MILLYALYKVFKAFFDFDGVDSGGFLLGFKVEQHYKLSQFFGKLGVYFGQRGKFFRGKQHFFAPRKQRGNNI